MYRRMMVAFDGSTASRAALDQALGLGAALHADLHVVHVADVTTVPGDAAPPNGPSLREQGDELLRQALRLAQQAGVACDTRLLEGRALGPSVSRLLADEARDSTADAVFVGSHGWRGVNRLFLGSVAEGLSRLCAVPVMIVHAPAAQG